MQPLLRGFKIDVNRAQFRISKKNQEITDVQLRQQIVATTRAVRLAYWTLVGARYNLGVAQASLDISRQTLRDNRTRVEVGTMAPIDVVGAEAEVARNEESAIIAAAQIDEAEDALRALIFDPGAADFWTMDLDLADAPQLPTSSVDVDVEGAVKVALGKRTDLIQVRKQLEISQINLDLAKDNTKPQVNAVVSYGLNGVGGVQVQRGPDDPDESVRAGSDHLDDRAPLRQRPRRPVRPRLPDLDGRRPGPLPARQQHPEGRRRPPAARLRSSSSSACAAAN